MRWRLIVTLLAAAMCTLGACDTGSGTSAPTASRSSGRSAPVSRGGSAPASPSAPASSPATAAPASILAAMSLAERVGQLLMVDCPSSGVSSATRTAVRDQHAGAVILDGTTTAGVRAMREVTDDVRRLAPAKVGLLVATDQEGGEVQRLQGAGFATVPSAVEQGRMAPRALRRAARTWGEQLRRAGVDVDLAPVLDTVPTGFGSNPPIGDLDREYGHTPGTVTSHGRAVLRGLAAAGIAATAKHFPGLGRVRGNTDTAAGVTDPVTTRHDGYLAPYRMAAALPVPLMMVSSAIYSKIDPGTPAAFSHTVVTGMLRGDLGYRGVVISDDLGAAAQVSDRAPGTRAVDFVRAGGDVVLTVDPGTVEPMAQALFEQARTDPGFRRQVDAAALRVLDLKQRLGLLHG